MVALIKNFILDTSNAPGTAGTINLAGAPAGRLSFAAFPSGSAVYYFMDDGTQAEWGFGTFTAGSPNTLTRTVISNTSGTSARLNFAGSTRVYNDIPAEQSVYLDTSSDVALPGTLTTAGALSVTTGGLAVVAGGVTITAGGLTVSAGGAAITGNSAIAGTLAVGAIASNAALTVSGGGAAITGNSTIAGNLTVTSAGIVTVGTTVIGNSGNVILNAAAPTGGYAFMAFENNGTPIGSVTYTGSSAVSYNTSSDYRLKMNLEPLRGALRRIAQLPVYRFNWIADETAAKVDGVLAHEAARVVPESVTGEKDGSAFQMIDHSKLVPLLIAAVQELSALLGVVDHG